MKYFTLVLTFLLLGCYSYKGGKVVDGTNLEVGLSIPGTEGQLTINAMAYTGGLKVCGDERTSITVTNEVVESNSYFGVVSTQRHTKMSAVIAPCDFCYLSATNETDCVDKSDTK